MPHSPNPNNVARLQNEVRHWRSAYHDERHARETLVEINARINDRCEKLTARMAELEAALRQGVTDANVRLVSADTHLPDRDFFASGVIVDKEA